MSIEATRRGSRRRFKRILAKLQLKDAGLTFKIKHARGAYEYEVRVHWKQEPRPRVRVPMRGDAPELKVIADLLVAASDAVHMVFTEPMRPAIGSAADLPA